MATFQFHVFWQSVNDIEMDFCPNMCILMDKVKWHFRWVFYHFTNFWFKNAKMNFFKKLSLLSAIFIDLKFRWLQTRLTDLKNTNSWFLLMTDFYDYFKNLNLCIFRYFRKSSAAHTKMIVCVLLMWLCWTKHNTAWSTHFLTIFFSRLVSTSGFKVKVI